MADRKISELAALTGAGADGTDLLHTVDLSEAPVNQNKKITLQELNNFINPAPQSYSPVFSGLADVTGVQASYAVRNNVMALHMELTTGPVAGTGEIQFGLPSGFQVASNLSNIFFLGLLQRAALTTARYGLIGSSGDTFLNTTRLDTGAGAFSPIAQTGNIGSNEILRLSATLFVEAV